MFRWIAYSGQPLELSKLVHSPVHSLYKQGQYTQMNFDVNGILLQTNGDGHGVGWYAEGIDSPCIVKDKGPIWNNENLKNICAFTRSHLFMAHVRLTTTGKVHRENSHPFSYKNWVFQHNGYISNFPKVRRDLQMDIHPDLYHHLEGTTDSETIFYLALTYGLDKDPKKAIEQVIKRLREAATKRNTSGRLNLSCSFSDGNHLYTIRYGENVTTKSQFYSKEVVCLSDFPPKTVLPSIKT